MNKISSYLPDKFRVIDILKVVNYFFYGNLIAKLWIHLQLNNNFFRIELFDTYLLYAKTLGHIFMPDE